MLKLNMLFNNSAIAFGRNETFALRYNWIFKGISSLKENPDIFSSPDALNHLGVGKNMMLSMRYWLLAYKLTDKDNHSDFSDLAAFIFDPDKGKDPFIEDVGTLWLLHWNLCTNPTQATLYYWFFNFYNKTSFSKSEVLNSLEDWIEFKSSRKVSSKTLERDINLLLKTYSAVESTSENFEDLLENPFYEMALINKNLDGNFRCSIQHRDTISKYLLGYFIADLKEYFTQQDLINGPKNFDQLPVSEILNSTEMPSIQKIFKTTEDCLYFLLEELQAAYPAVFKLDDTAGQKNLYINNLPNKLTFLEDYYSNRK
ncbi:MAG: DUF4007 family protein [Gammaproteobacteria bacterium]